VDVRWWSTERTGSVFSIVPFVHYEVLPDLFVDFDFAVAPQSGGSSVPGLADVGARLGLGNPTLGARYVSTNEDSSLTLSVGGRVGLPLATLGDLQSDRANDLASAANGHADFYRWVPELMPLAATACIELHPSRALWLRLPVEALLAVPTTARRELKTGVVARFEIEGQSRDGVGGGAALQIAVSDGFRTRDEDRAQVAIEPYFGVDNDRFFGRFGLLMALDPPLGPGFLEGGVITAHVQAGGHLP
jgi:hypothetical protein